MIIGVDVGGTKTYLAMFAQSGKLLKEVRFETSHDYGQFLNDLKQYADQLETSKAKIACAAVPGRIDRKKGLAISLGNLPWKDRYIKHDLAEVLGVNDMYIENDSKLAGLAEAKYIVEEYKRVFYLTVSTGIGGALMVNGKLVKELIDMEIGKMPLEHNGITQPWEQFASGRAFYEKYQKKAIDIEDEKIWKSYSAGLNKGLGIICANYQVEAIVFGGGLGQHLSRFKKYLTPYLDKNLHEIVTKPSSLLSTHYRGQSVVYGCYHYVKDKLA